MGKLNPENYGALCLACPFAIKGKPNNPVTADGPADPQAVLVGDSPGAEEVEQGRLFVGPTGKDLDNSLERAGLGRKKLLLVNAVCCRPPLDKKAESHMALAVRCCRPAFDAQTSEARRKRIPHLAMGKWAWTALGAKIPKGGLTKGRGFLRELADGTPYIATWHPIFAFFRNPFEWGAFEVDLGRFSRLLAGRLRAGPDSLLVDPSVREAESLFAEGLPVAVDIETGPQTRATPWTGKDPTRATLRTIGLGNCRRGVSFVWDSLVEADRAVLVRLIRENHTVWQNGPWFDHRVLARYGFEVGAWDDTRDMRMVLDPVSPLSLAYLASLYDDCGAWKEDDSDDEKGLVFTDDMEKLCRYNAQDCVETARAWEGLSADFQRRIPSHPQVIRLYEMQKRRAVICAKMHTRGIYVHAENRAELDRELLREFDLRSRKLQDAAGNPEFGGDPDSMRRLIFSRYAVDGQLNFGLPDPMDDERWTEGGKIAVDQAALMSLATNPQTPPKLVEIINLYWAAAACQKARSTFVVSDKVEQAIGEDGRLRPGWNSCGTDTGRLSCSEPNVMTLSKEKD